MNLEKIFEINEEQKIRDIINDIPLENCINNFITYLDLQEEQKETLSSLERDFLNELKLNLKDFIWSLTLKDLSNKTEENLIEKIKTLLFKGSIVLDACYYEDLLDIFQNEYNDADIYQNIKEYMLITFNNMLRKKRLTEREKNINKYIKNIKNIKAAIADFNKRIEENENTLKENIEKLKELNVDYTEI